MNRRWSDDTPRLPLSRCPHCGKKLDAASRMEGPQPLPKPDDLTVCIGCGEVLAFDGRLHLRKVSATELATVARSVQAELRRTQRVIRAFLASEAP
jgi:hypothetical protein